MLVRRFIRKHPGWTFCPMEWCHLGNLASVSPQHLAYYVVTCYCIPNASLKKLGQLIKSSCSLQSTKMYRHKSDWKIRPEHSKKNKCLCIFINNNWNSTTVDRCYCSITKTQTVLYSLNQLGVKYSKQHIEWLVQTYSWQYFLQSRASFAGLSYSYGNRSRKLNGSALTYYLSSKIRR